MAGLVLYSFPLIDSHWVSISLPTCIQEPGAPEASGKTSYEVKNPLVGCKSQINELRKYLAKASLTTKVISVWGMAGVGKTSFVKHLYFDLSTTSQYGKYIWVDMSYPFNLRGFCQSLLTDYDSHKDPIQECRQVLKQHRCLVVVDNLQSKKEWDMIQSALVSKSSRSVIIVITTAASIAAYCTNDQEFMFKIKGLEAAEAFDFFKSEVRLLTSIFSVGVSENLNTTKSMNHIDPLNSGRSRN